MFKKLNLINKTTVQIYPHQPHLNQSELQSKTHQSYSTFVDHWMGQIVANKPMKKIYNC